MYLCAGLENLLFHDWLVSLIVHAVAADCGIDAVVSRVTRWTWLELCRIPVEILWSATSVVLVIAWIAQQCAGLTFGVHYVCVNPRLGRLLFLIRS